MEHKTVLVTGGAGFIGSHLCERLVSLGNTVVSLDNYFSGSKNNHIAGVEYIFGSTENILIDDHLADKSFDVVYHLGEYSRVEQSFDDFDLVWRYNKLGTHAVLQYVKKTKAKLIYAGSSTKFVEPSSDYMQSPYAWSKASNTEYVKQYCLWNDIDYAITYFYNVYGKREISEGRYATLIAKYKYIARTGGTLPVVMPGTQLRNFTYIDDIVDALVLIGENGHGDEYGIGSPHAYSVLEVAEMFGLPIKCLEPRKGNRMSADVVTAKTESLGWSPKYDLPSYIETIRKNGWYDV